MADSLDVKHYSRSEERLSYGVHLLGAAIVLLGAWIPLKPILAGTDKILQAGTLFYLISLFLMFGCSSAYHIAESVDCKAFLRKVDHSAIYLLITGTYAPLMLGGLKSVAGNVVLLVLILLTVFGIAGKWIFGHRFHHWEVGLYLLMGWACVFVIRPLYYAISCTAFIWLFSGGIAYSMGVIPYLLRIKYSHALWHVFVLAGASCHYLAIYFVLCAR